MSGAKDILNKAESIDHYITSCGRCKYNRAARSSSHYIPYFLDESETARLYTFMSFTELLKNTDVIILHSSAENGYPHTRPPSLICLPESVVRHSTHSELDITLRHEAIHIHQRRMPDLWKEKCVRDGWVPFKAENIPAQFRNRCRLNPDTMYDTPFWAWKGEHIPLPIFTRENPSSIGDVSIQWLDLKYGTLFHEPPKSFVKMYGNPSQPEHPYEILAVKYANEGVHTFSELLYKLSQ